MYHVRWRAQGLGAHQNCLSTSAFGPILLIKVLEICSCRLLAARSPLASDFPLCEKLRRRNFQEADDVGCFFFLFFLPGCLIASLMNTGLGRQERSNRRLQETWRGLGMAVPGDTERHYPTKGAANHVATLNLDFISYIDLIRILSVFKSDLYLNWSPSLWQVSSAIYISIHDI